MELRKVQRTAYCRGCDKELIRNVDNIIYMYSSRNTGQNIIICEGCVRKMYRMIGEA